MEKKELTSWQGVGIGTTPWLVLVIIVLLAKYTGIIKFPSDTFIFLCLATLPAIPGGFTGVVIAKKQKKNRKTIWIGAIIGAVIATVFVGSCLFILPCGVIGC